MEDGLAKEVLIVSYRFPPQGGIAALRIGYFVKYLSEFGWHPRVLARHFEDFELRDPSLSALIPDTTQVVWVTAPDPFGVKRLLDKPRLADVAPLMTVPSLSPSWIPGAYRSGLKLLRDSQSKAIFSTSPPISSHVVAYLLKKRTGLPWIAEYRDEWSLHPATRWPSAFHKGVARRLDQSIMRSADLIVTTSPAYSALFAREFSLPAGKFVTITNGFDEEDFAAARIRPLRRDGRPFRIGYVGTLAGVQNAEPFLTAVQELIMEEAIPAEKIALHFTGRADPLNWPLLEERGVLHLTGYVDHKTAVSHMLESDVLLLILTHERGANTIPAKTFEYLGSGRPVLALVPPQGPVATIIKEAKAGLVVDPNNVGAIKQAIVHFFHCWQEDRLDARADVAYIQRYTRRRLAGKLASLLDSVCGAQEGPRWAAATQPRVGGD